MNIVSQNFFNTNLNKSLEYGSLKVGIITREKKFQDLFPSMNMGGLTWASLEKSSLAGPRPTLYFHEFSLKHLPGN